MKYGFIILTAAVCIFTGCSNDSATEKKDDDIGTARKLEGKELVERGNYIMLTGGCNDCHTPKVFSAHGMSIDSTRLFSGHRADAQLPPINPDALKPGNWVNMGPEITAFVGPWGISYAANLTPDSTTGIGAWSEATFIKALRTGKHMGIETGRPIMPPMPAEYIGKMNDDDLRAIYAYLRSIPAVNNKVPAPVPPNEVMAKK